MNASVLDKQSEISSSSLKISGKRPFSMKLRAEPVPSPIARDVTDQHCPKMVSVLLVEKNVLQPIHRGASAYWLFN